MKTLLIVKAVLLTTIVAAAVVAAPARNPRPPAPCGCKEPICPCKVCRCVTPD